MNRSYLFLGLSSPLSRQTGVAFLLLIMVLVLSTTTLLMMQVSRNKQSTLRSINTLDVMNFAKDALLGYALNQAVPGTLPCPDVDGDGDSDAVSGGCSAVAAWLPFRSLGLDDLRDSSGAKLWYVVDPTYTQGLVPYNSSADSNLRANGVDSAFVLLAPNTALDGQIRAAGNISRTNYFEGLNSDADVYVYQQNISDNNNDQVLSYPLGKFWALLENSIVLPVAATALNDYYASCGAYPWVAAFGAVSLDSVVSLQQGGLPLDSAVASDGSACAANLIVPSWLRSHWGDQLQYSFCLNTQGQCLNISGDRVVSTAAVLISPGISLTGQVRPSTQLSQYFENANQLNTTQFIYRFSSNHDGSFNDVVHTVP